MREMIRDSNVGNRNELRTGESIPLLCASSWDREFTATLHRAQ